MTIGTYIRTAYRAFGLVVGSEIPLPELINLNEKEKRIDIIIKIDDLYEIKSKLITQKGKFVVNERKVLFSIPNLGVFCIQEGNQIIISPLKGADLDKIRLYVLGTCMGVILLQREILPLHGSAVNIGGKAYGFIGASGVGKSTLASVFIGKGFQLLSDDVIAVASTKDNIPYVMPSYPQQKLWKETLNEFGMESVHYRPLFDRETKYSIPVTLGFNSDPLPLGGVFELSKTDNDEIQIRAIKGLERFQTLYNHTFRNALINRMGLDEWHFMFSSKLINHIDMFEVKRPTSKFTAYDMVSNILDQIN